MFTSFSVWQWAGLAVAAALVAWIWIAQGARLARFVGETRSELKKCTWPWNPQEKFPKSHKELVESTVVVAVSALFLAAFVTTWDFLLVHVIGLFTHLK